MKTSRTIGFAGIVLGFALAGGCAETSHIFTGELPPPTSKTLTTQQFSDIPVPKDFVLLEKPIPSLSFTGSYVLESSGTSRQGQLLYSGRQDVAVVYDFYRSQMVLPVNGWMELEQQLGEKDSQLLFEKNGTRSHLHIFQKSGETFVMIEVSSAHEG